MYKDFGDAMGDTSTAIVLIKPYMTDITYKDQRGNFVALKAFSNN